jgi:hypothetical protein
MRGFPPFQVMLMAAGLTAAALPVVQLTSGPSGASGVRTAASPGAEVTPSGQVPTEWQVRVAHPLTHLRLESGGIRLVDWPSAESPTVPLSGLVHLSPLAEGAELIVTAEWAPGTPDTALTLTLVPLAAEEKSLTQWSTGPALTGVFSFVWP